MIKNGQPVYIAAITRWYSDCINTNTLHWVTYRLKFTKRRVYLELSFEFLTRKAIAIFALGIGNPVKLKRNRSQSLSRAQRKHKRANISDLCETLGFDPRRSHSKNLAIFPQKKAANCKCLINARTPGQFSANLRSVDLNDNADNVFIGSDRFVGRVTLTGRTGRKVGKNMSSTFFVPYRIKSHPDSNSALLSIRWTEVVCLKMNSKGTGSGDTSKLTSVHV